MNVTFNLGSPLSQYTKHCINMYLRSCIYNDSIKIQKEITLGLPKKSGKIYGKGSTSSCTLLSPTDPFPDTTLLIEDFNSKNG